ncbi:GDSL esterase/lipase At5g22810-like [Carya illinoinensis]|uniref:GDSL esterase/lipase At5g22810-like n=1 Tax=Carya illinoinensis TaxID=32201 RepID=UPI001C7186AA|nr:GDSL esterase/lipase At5g22810-like [Carya illinoinensis]
MGFPSPSLAPFLTLFLVFFVADGQSSVHPFFIFGDYVVDIGNNHIYTFIKANFPPYGRDFVRHERTGRFCNGKLAIDFIADMLGLTYPPPYLSGRDRGTNLLIGANFVSASSSYYDATANLYRAIPLSRQLWYYREYQNRLAAIVGRSNVASIMSCAIFIFSAGSSDFLQNYYVNPLLYLALTPDRFSDLLIQSYMHFIQRLYALGARRIGVTTLPPIRCLPATITIFGMGSNVWVESLNNDAVSFNYKLNATSHSLQNNLHDLKLVVFDAYQPLYEIATNPSKHGFFVARRACCGTGLLETLILCNQESIGTCANASEYVFWDGLHPSEAANYALASRLASSDISLITP